MASSGFDFDFFFHFGRHVLVVLRKGHRKVRLPTYALNYRKNEVIFSKCQTGNGVHTATIEQFDVNIGMWRHEEKK